ncbi:MAG: spore coat protein CotH [Lachnospiraceae bacterium]|jgi:spore coat protein H|nr:spore coat protein CotH [Lachnospiraceae bacterium]
MKYKIISLAAVAGMLLLVIFVNQSPTPGLTRVHQHLTWEKQSQSSEVTTDPEELVTHLPIVEIRTGDKKIPGNWVYEEDGANTGAELSEDGEKTILVSVRIIDSGTGENRVEDEASVETKARFRIRGNSSRNFSKKSYLLKLVDQDGKENPQEIMGMSQHDQWALYGPFLDKTLMRNYMWMNLSAEVMGYAPNVRYCEVILDGAYQGLYLMMENISRGEGRVNIGAYEEGKPYTDYIVRVDKANHDIRDLNTFGNYTLRMVLGVDEQAVLSVVYPGRQKLTEEICDYIARDFSRFEKTLYSSDYTDPIRGYRRYVDVDSFVDYYVLQEFLCNNDMCSRSTYLYKDRLNKLHMGPVWDYNNMLDNYFTLQLDGSEFLYVERLWFDRLLADPYFNRKVIRRYRELRETILAEDYLMDYIDETIAYLGDSIERNYQVWGYSFDAKQLHANERLTPLERNPKSFPEAVEDMKTFIRVRGRWMDNHIDALAQYCHESKTKSYDNR